MSTTQTWIAGQVVDREGQPLAGVAVAVAGGSGQQASVTGADGAFRIDGLRPGTFVLQARIDGAVGAMLVDARHGPAQGLAMRVPVGPAAGEQTGVERDAVRAAAASTGAGSTSAPAAASGTAPAQPRLGWIEGRVLDAAGNPVAGARVSVTGGPQPARDIARLSTGDGRTRVGAWQPWRQASQAVSSAGGGYHVADVPPGPYVVEARKGAAVGTADIAVRAGQATWMDLRLA